MKSLFPVARKQYPYNIVSQFEFIQLKVIFPLSPDRIYIYIYIPEQRGPKRREVKEL